MSLDLFISFFALQLWFVRRISEMVKSLLCLIFRMKFNKDDLGKRVLLELDVDKDQFAKALGASKVTLSGTIIEIGETSFRIKADMPRFAIEVLKSDELQEMMYILYGSSRKRIKTIDYDMIKKYEFEN